MFLLKLYNSSAIITVHFFTWQARKKVTSMKNLAHTKVVLKTWLFDVNTASYDVITYQYLSANEKYPFLCLFQFEIRVSTVTFEYVLKFVKISFEKYIIRLSYILGNENSPYISNKRLQLDGLKEICLTVWLLTITSSD